MERTDLLHQQGQRVARLLNEDQSSMLVFQMEPFLTGDLQGPFTREDFETIRAGLDEPKVVALPIVVEGELIAAIFNWSLSQIWLDYRALVRGWEKHHGINYPDDEQQAVIAYVKREWNADVTLN